MANVSAGEIWLTIAPDADYGATVKAIKAQIDDYAGLDLKLQTYQQKQADAMKSAAKTWWSASTARKVRSSTLRPMS